jgi:hypothetical protein
MPDLKSRFRGADQIPSPDLWPEIVQREPNPPGREIPWGRLGTAAVAFTVAAAGIALAARAFLGDPPQPARRGPSGAVDPRVTATIPVGPFPANVAAGEGAIWVTVNDPNPPEEWWVARIDPASNEVTDRIQTLEGQDVAVGAGSVWVTGWERETGPVLLRIDPQGREVAGRVDLSCCGQSANQVAAVDGAVWVTMTADYPKSSEVVRIDPTTGEVIARIPVEGDARDLVVDGGGVWVYALTHFSQGEGVAGGTLYRIDPTTNRLVDTLLAGEIPPASGVSSPPILAVGDGFVWIPIGGGNRIVRINSVTGEVAEPPVHLDGYAWPFAVSDGGLWLRGPNSEDVGAPISRVDTQTLRVDASLALEEGLAIDATYHAATDTLWLASYRHSVTRIDLRPASEPANSLDETPLGPAPTIQVPQGAPSVAFTPGCRHEGPWTHCFQAAQWIQQVVDEAGYEVVSDRLSGFLVEGGGLKFGIHATDEISADQLAAGSYRPLGTVDGTVVYSDGTRITWHAQGLSVWVSAHLLEEPSLDTIAPLLRASDQVPYVPEADG